MSPGSPECDLEPLASHAADRDVVTPSEWIERNEHFDFVFVRSLLKQVLHPAQISGAFFANVSDEENVAGCLNFGGVHRANHLEQHCQGARIIADTGSVELRSFTADLDVCAFGKNRVEVSSNRDGGAGSAALACSNHITFGVDLDIRQPALPQHFHERFGAPRFLERWRFDFRDLNNLTNEAIVILCDKILCSLKFGVRQDTLNTRSLKDEEDAKASRDLRKQLSLRRLLQRLCPSSASRGTGSSDCATATDEHRISSAGSDPAE